MACSTLSNDLSRETALLFIQEQLNLNSFVKQFGEHPVNALNSVVKQFHLKIPFQNLTHLAKDSVNQTIPTRCEIIEDVLAGYGGLCYTNNVFMKFLLDALGLDTYHATSCCNPRHPDNHIVTIIRDLQGKDYLVDVGSGYPTYQLIDIGFHGDSEVNHDAYMSYYFTREGNLIKRFNRDRRVSGSGGEKHTDWILAYTVLCEAKSLDYFAHSMREVYEDRWLRKLRYLKFTETALEAVKESENGPMFLCLGKDDSISQMMNLDEMQQKLIQYKTIPKIVIDAAVSAFTCPEHKHQS